ncbi:MAG: hypothetical protein WCK34_07005 [Bacteroidota bacterium]
MEEHIFSWSFDGFGSKLFRIRLDDQVRFVNRYSSMDGGDDNREERNLGEYEYSSFGEFWHDFTDQPLWLRYHPVFIHRDYHPYLRIYFETMNQGALTMGEQFSFILWMHKIEQENSFSQGNPKDMRSGSKQLF